MKNSKIIIIVIVILAALIVTLVVANGSKNTTNVDFYISKYSPNSLAYFNCKAEGMKADNLCGRCENIFEAADKNRASHSINNDADLVEYVRSQNKDCINLTAGGN